jgi:hypothetical protein
LVCKYAGISIDLRPILHRVNLSVVAGGEDKYRVVST